MTADPNAAEDPLARLFAGLYGEQDAAAQVLSDDQLATLLVRVNPQDDDPVLAVRKAAGGAALSVRQLGIVRLARELLRDYFNQPVFHPQLARRLLAVSGPLIAEALPRDGWLMRRQHPVHELMALVEEVAKGWFPALPQAED